MRLSLMLFLVLSPVSGFADALSDANQLFDFAEIRFAKFFSPAGQATQELKAYLVRYYPDTNTYLGARDGEVYVHGQPFGVGIVRVGKITDFITPSDSGNTDTANTGSGTTNADGIVDLTNLILSRRTGSCADYAGGFESSVQDLSRSLSFTGSLDITVANGTCVFTSNGIPNHDMGENGAFATPVSEVNLVFSVPANPVFANNSTALTLDYDNAILLNGVKVDIFAAACFGVADEKIGCFDIEQPWRFDPMSPLNNFGTDVHNAHTQPDGTYHYHGNPRALFDFNTATESPVVGFAADGFPIFGSYFNASGVVRKAESSYQLAEGSRPSGSGEPGGTYDGTFRDDYDYIEGSGDLDECNGMTVDGVYGYFITDSFPWIINCFKGTPDSSFRKAGAGGAAGGIPPGNTGANTGSNVSTPPAQTVPPSQVVPPPIPGAVD